MPVNALKILLIDDDPDILNTVPTNLENTLREQGVAARIVTIDNVDAGIEELRSKDFHLAVVDLRFASPERSGNDIIATILEARILPVIVFSVFRNELDEEFEQHGLIYSAKTKKAAELVDKILEWNQKEVFSFFSEAGFVGSALRVALQQTMWRHVSRYWEYIETEDTLVLHRIAGRIAATLFYDVLAFSPDCVNVGGETPIHHGEIYIFDTPRNCLTVGDILALEDELFVVLSPSCDLVVRPEIGPKADMVLMAQCHDLCTYVSEHQSIRDQVEAVCQGERKAKAQDRLLKLMHQDWENPSGRYFFLPPFAYFSGGVVDFLKLKTESYGTAEAEELIGRRVVSLNRDMAAELATRFARYMIRLGQPAYDANPLIKAICDIAPTLD